MQDIQSVLGRIILYGDEGDEEIQAGEILGYWITCDDPDEVVYLADQLNQDFFETVQILPDLEDEFAICQPALYISQVFLEPQWRGHSLALESTALYIHFLANHGFIFFSPAPPGVRESPERERQIKRLRRYWRKLGIHHYNPEHNVMWQAGWSYNEWLESQAQRD
ncbi:MAG: hypothetical protein HC921_06540 [Synechococcaceae cyanobacterium SM2_3_1]|nr:hypothetical protein [Synechococcaceae cyanobacterium SM2_3_1]